MATNTLLTIKMITNECLRILENNLSFTKNVNRQYQDRFAKTGAKIGNRIDVRLPVKYAVTSGPALQVQDTVEKFVSVVVDHQDHVDFEFSSEDMALSIDDFSDRYLKPGVAELANRIDFNGLKLVNKIYNTVGNPTSLADELRVYLLAKAKLDDEAVPRDDLRAVVIDPSTEAGLVDKLKGLFNSTTEVAAQYRDGNMGRTAGFKFSMDQNVQTHTNGTGAADPVLMNGANQLGDTFTVKGLVGNLKEGDTFTIANVYAVNPMSKQSTGKLRQFVVLNDVANGGTSLSVSPAIVATGPYKNVTVAPANNAPLTFIGGAGATFTLGVAFHRDAFTLACVDLPLVGGTDKCARVSDPQLGLSIRMIRDYMIGTDQLVTRLDVLYGWAILRPEMACKIVTDTTKL